MRAWAVTDDKGISIKTVGPTRTSAMVNWLFIPEGGNIIVTREFNDEMVRTTFELMAASKKARVVEVEVLEVQ